MIENMKKTGILLEKTADRILLAIAALLSWGLTYYSMRYTELLRDETEIPVTVTDSIVRNIAAFLAVTAVFFLVRSMLIRKSIFHSYRIQKAVIAAAMVYITAISLIWVSICHVTPRADSSTLCTVAEYILQGKYDTMLPPGYMSYYPHQFSLLAVIQLLFSLFGSGNYQSFQYMNALCMPLLFYSGYRILMLIYGRLEPVLYYIAAFVSCLPLFLYIPYVYGEITSITFTMVLMWQTVRYCTTGRRSCGIWGTLAVVFACIMRRNSMIVLIAAGIVLLLYALRTAKPQAAVWLLVMVLSVFAANSCIRAYYEHISENEIPDGAPYISYILMGLKDGEAGPGWHDGTDSRELSNHNYDTEQTAIDCKKAVNMRLRELWEDKPYTVSFFRRKVLSQWNSPAYHSLYETCSFDCEPDDLPEAVSHIYYKNRESIHAFMNRYQFVLYLCTAVMATATLFSGKRTGQLEDHVLLIAVTGGFLFSILWEAMSRYVLPYTVYMIPMAAAGMWRLQELLAAAFVRLQKGRHRAKQVTDRFSSQSRRGSIIKDSYNRSITNSGREIP